MESQASVVLGQMSDAERNRLQLQNVVYTIETWPGYLFWSI